MHRTVLVSAIVVLLSAIVPAFAADCNCTQSGERPCFVMINCEGEEVPRCSCGLTGCASSCGPVCPFEAEQTFSSFQMSDLLLEGLGPHFGEDSGWKFVIAAPTTERETINFADMSFASLMRAVAEMYGMCAELSAEDKVVTFKPLGTCE